LAIREHMNFCLKIHHFNLSFCWITKQKQRWLLASFEWTF